MSNDAVIVSYARTGLAKAGRGGFNMTPAMTMAAHAMERKIAEQMGLGREANQPDVRELSKDTSIDAMAQQKVFIGRIWPCMPTCVRITVGTHDEMQHFQTAFQKVMSNAVALSMRPLNPQRKRRISAPLPS